MPRIASIGTAVPPYAVSQEKAREFAREMFGRAFCDIDRLLRVFDNANIQKRYFTVPMEWFKEHHSFREKNDTYIRAAADLSAEAVERCLSRARLKAQQVDHLIFVSTTGLSTPSIDALLANRFNMSRHLKRTPVWGLGCAGGAVGLSRAYEFAKAFPESRVLLVTLELCSLTFQRHDLSKSNLIATSLFGDGAAAVLVYGDDVDSVTFDGPSVLASMSTLWEDTEDVMGWDIADNGLNVVFSKDIPTIVKTLMRANMEQFLAGQQLTLSQIKRFVTHPGGMKVIDAYEEALELSPDQTTPAKSVLSQYGNMSSASVLFVLDEMMQVGRPGDYGIVTALGPGFSSEQLLLRW
jgi:alkylresorcinol/alkylpyrone synthase